METYESVKSNPVQPEQKEKKKGGAWKGIVAVILAAGVVGSTTISAFNLVTLKSYIAEQKKEENPETTEDYVKIADNYEIKPTTNISDAYKSGDTSKLTDKEKETLDMAKKAIKDMKITDSMSDFELVDELSRIANVTVPNAIEEIRTAPVLHDTVCDKEDMKAVVMKFLGI